MKPRVSLGERYLARLRDGAPEKSVHLPDDLAALIDSAETAPVPPEYGPEYEAVAAHFDRAYYFGQYADVARSRLDPVAHYLRAGAEAGRNPHPFFSGKAYLRETPEAPASGLTPFGHWATSGASDSAAASAASETPFSRLAPLFGASPAALRAHLVRRHNDVRDRLVGGTLGQMARAAQALDPLIGASWSEVLAPRILPFANDQVTGRILALNDLQSAAGWRRARAVLVTGRDTSAGDPGDALLAALTEAVAAHIPAEEIVVLRLGPGGFGDLWEALRATGIRLLEKPSELATLPADMADRVVVEFLRSLAPEICILEASGPGSERVWSVMEAYGRQLSAAVPLIAWMPDCASLDASLSARFYRYFPLLAGLWLPGEDVIRALAEQFGLSQAERAGLGVLPATGIVRQGAGTPRHILGRARDLHAPELDLFMAVAAAMPEDLRFTLVLDQAGRQRRYKYFPQNVTCEMAGEAGHTAAEADAGIWLDTGGGGVAEAVSTGMPVVAARAACANEGIDPALCWCPDAEETGVDALASALKQALAEPEERAHRGATLARQRASSTAQALGPLLAAVPKPTPYLPPDPVPAQSQADHLLTVAITAHGETHVAGPTLRSVSRAIAVLEAVKPDIKVEVLVGFDAATAACRAYFASVLPEFLPDARTLEFDFRDQGRTRNALAAVARGHFFAVVDADDLISENWLSRAVTLLEEREAQGIDTIAHPEVNWQFEGAARVQANPNHDDPLFSPHAMAVMNYYDAMCVAPTRLWHTLPYARRDLAQGFALEDYQWFVEATARGWRHANVPDTLIFKRRRDTSQHRESRRAGALIRAIEPLRIDNLQALGR